MPIDASIPYEALKGLQRAEPYDPMAFQARLERQRMGGQQGPNAAVLRLGQEQQENQEIAAIAQQYGDDYDEMGKAIIARFPHRADVVGGIQTALKDGAAKHLAMTVEARAKLQSRLAELQGADATTWEPVTQDIVKEFPQLSPLFAGRPYSPELQQQIVGIGQSQDQWLDAQGKAAQSLLDGKKQEGAARLIVAADTPAKQTELQGLLAQAGWKKFLGVMPDAASAQAYLDKQAKAEPSTAAKVGTFEDYMVEKYGPRPTPDQIIEGRKKYGQADDKAVKVSMAGGAAGGEGLNPEGLDYAATQYRLTGKMPPMGMGKTPDRFRIINKAAEQARLIGQTPAAAIQKQAVFAGDAKALAQLQKMQGASDAYENKAQSQLDIVDTLSDKVGRTKFPILNRAIIAGKTEIVGDPDATLLLNAILTASTEYAKIMAGGTASAAAVTDSAQKEAQKLLNASMSQGTLRKATALMRQEMGLTMQGYDAAISHINDRMGGQPPATTPATTAAPKRQNWVFDKNGKLVPQ